MTNKIFRLPDDDDEGLAETLEVIGEMGLPND